MSALFDRLTEAGDAYVAEELAAATAPLTAEIASLGREVDAAEANANNLAGDVAQLERDLAARDARIAELEARPITTTPRLTRIGEPGKAYVMRAGEVLTDVEFAGTVDMGAHSTIRRAIVRMGPNPRPTSTAVHAGVKSTAGRVGDTVLDQVTIVPSHPDKMTRGIQGTNILTIGCDISGTVDGVLVSSGDWIDHGSRIHDLVWYPTTAPEGTHNDGAQLQGAGGRVLLVGTDIDVSSLDHPSRSLAALMITNDAGALASFRAYGIAVRGGFFPINVSRDTIPDFQIINSKLGPGTRTVGGRRSAVILKAAQRAVARFDGTTMLDGRPLELANG